MLFTIIIFYTLSYNPVNENWGKRTALVISKSHDNGKIWTQTIILEDFESEYSYLSIIDAEGFLHSIRL